MISPRENLLRTLRRQGFDRVPLDPNEFCPSQVEAFRRRLGNDDYMAFFGAPVRSFWVGVEPTCAEWRPLYRRETLPDDIDFDAFGVGHYRHPGCHHMTKMHHPLRGEDLVLEELRRYPFPRFNPETKAAHRAFVQARHKQGLAFLAETAPGAGDRGRPQREARHSGPLSQLRVRVAVHRRAGRHRRRYSQSGPA